MKRLILLIGLVLGLYAPASHALAQVGCGVNFTPAIGVNCANIRAATYSAAMVKLVPAASSTDIFCISAGTKNVRIRRIEMSGSGTAVAVPVYLLHRATLDTGTVATTTYVPGIASLNTTSNPTATATVVGYNSTGGVPTITDSSPTYLRTGVLAVQATTVGSPADRLVWQFGTTVDAYNQGVDLTAGGTEQVCLNLATTSITAVLEGYIEWTEN